MQELGIVTAAQATDAKKPVKSMLRIQKSEGGTCARSDEPFFCQYVMEYMLGLKALGANRAERLLNINRGGLRIHTTLRTDWQAEIFRDLTARVPTGDPSGVGAAAAVVEARHRQAPRDGPDVPVRLDRQGVVRCVAPPRAGCRPAEIQGDPGVPDRIDGEDVHHRHRPRTRLAGQWSVPAPAAGPNANQAHLPAQRLSRRVQFARPLASPQRRDHGGPVDGLPGRDSSLRQHRLRRVDDRPRWPRGPEDDDQDGLLDGAGDPTQPAPSSLVLGSGSVPPLTLANSYATLAADGKFCDINPIDRIETANGKKIKLPATKCKQVISPDVARGATELLKGVIQYGTGTAAGIGRPAAGSTGTHEAHQQSWFVGYTPQLATAVDVGTPITSYEMKGWHAVIGGISYGEVFGGTIAAPLWGTIMRQLEADMPVEGFTSPSSAILYGNLSPLPGVLGMSLDGAIATLKANGFYGFYLGTQNSTAPAGTVVATTRRLGGQGDRRRPLSLDRLRAQAAPANHRQAADSHLHEPFDDALVRHRQPDQTSADLAQRHRHPDRLSASPPNAAKSSRHGIFRGARTFPCRIASCSSRARTRPATRPPSARPATRAWTAFMTVPICAIPLAPVSAMTSSRIASTAASSSRVGDRL